MNDLQDKFDLEKGRLKVGAEWKITKKHRLDVAYLWDKDADDESNSNHHVISLGYKFKFWRQKLKKFGILFVCPKM